MKLLYKLFKFSPYIVLIAIFAIILKLNQLTPLWADDFCRLDTHFSVGSAITKTLTAYFNWSGRVVPLFFTYLTFGNFPNSIPVFNIVNSLIFTSLIYIVFIISFDRKPIGLRDAVKIALIFDLIFIATKGIGEVVFWKTGSIGYLWGATFELLYLIPLFLYSRGKTKLIENKKYFILFSIVALLGSFFIEHLSVSISFISLVILIERFVSSRKIPYQILTLISLHLIGTFALVLSPGNIVRSGSESVLPFVDRVLNNFNQLYPALGWILVFFWLLSLSNDNFKNDAKKSYLWLFLALAATTLFAYSFAPTELEFKIRVAFPFEISLILAITYLSQFLPKSLVFDISLFLILSLLGFAHVSTAILNYKNISIQYSNRMKFVEQSKKEGVTELTVEPLRFTNEKPPNMLYINKYNFKSDIGPDSSLWQNVCFSKAVGLGKITTSN